MGFIIKEENILVHCKLTDEGRRKISLGKFNPTKFSIGDSEVNYEYFTQNNHNIEDSFVNSPIDRYRKIKNTIKSNIEDQSDKYDLIINDIEERIYYRDVEDKGFFNGELYDNELKINNDFLKTKHFRIDISDLNTDNNYKLKIRKTSNYTSDTKEPKINDYIIIKWINPYSQTDSFINGNINSDNINPYIWYKIINVTGTLADNTIELTIDRELPNFGTQNTPNQKYSYGFIYPEYDSMKVFF